MRIRPKQINLSEDVTMQGGLIQLSDGTISQPSLTFGSTSTTGFFNDSGKMAIVTSGVKAWELDTSGVIRYTTSGGFGAPSGTTLQRPPNEAAVLRYNSDLSGFEYSDGTTWYQVENKKTWTFTGDATGSGNGSVALTLANVSGLTTGTFTKVNVDSKGRVTLGAQLASSDVTTALGYTPLQHNETITVTGDVSGSGTNSLNLTLPASGVTAGTYDFITVNAKGIVTGGTNPTGKAGQVVAGKIPALTSNTHITLGNTTPLITDGTQIFSDHITPSTISGHIIVQASFVLASGTTNVQFVVSAFRGSTSIGSTIMDYSNYKNNAFHPIHVTFVDQANSLSQQTYSLRVCTTATATWYVNETNTAYLNGALAGNGYVILEVT